MKIVLIYAKSQTIRGKAANAYAEEDTTNGEYSRDEIYPPLGIATLAGRLLEIGGFDVRLRDDSIDTLDELKESMRWADVVGISSLTPNAKRARELGRISRQEIGRFTVCGGPHPTTNPEYFLQAGAADVCVQGEGDFTLPELLHHKDDPASWDQIQGITFLRDGQLVATTRRELLKDMNAMPWPAWQLYDMPRYMSGMVTPGISIMTSRGCPFSCTFCDAEMTPRQYRAMSPERAVDMIEMLLRTYNPPQIFIFDDLFTIQRKRVIGICQEIVKRGLSFEWSCESRVDTVDFEMLRWMRRAGCVKIYFGLESGSPNVLVTMKKDVTPEKILAGAKLTREVGIYFKFFILYGFPSDTTEDHLLTEDLVVKARPDAISCSILVPIPGTEVYEEIKHQLIGDVTEQEFHFWHHSEFWKHPRFSHDEIVAERERLLKRHATAMTGLRPRLLRKWERLSVTLRKPVLVLDFVDVLLRKRRHKLRVRASGWMERHARDRIKLQVPTYSKH
ncbi:MAG: B12-binding domain-containing radical SAM protein [Planctomycetota bacterium]